ncbi:hypothetical protein D3C77_282830 [compost metagenome]
MGTRLAAPICLDDGDLKVAVGAAGVDIADLERPWWNVGGVEDVVILADLHGGVGLRHTTDDRCIATFAIGAHAFVRSQFQASVTHAVEQVGVTEYIAGTELALECGNVMLQVAAVAIERTWAAGSGAVVGFIAQSPRAEIDSVTQIQVIAHDCVGIAGAAATVELIVNKGSGYTIVPKLGIDIAAFAALHGDLRHADSQA